MGFAGAANAQFYIGAHGGVNFVPDSDMDDPLVPHPHKAGELSTVAGITDGMSASCERIPWLTVLTCPWRSLATSAAIQRVLPRTNQLMPTSFSGASQRRNPSARSEERRVGKGWGSTCRSRWSPVL